MHFCASVDVCSRKFVNFEIPELEITEINYGSASEGTRIKRIRIIISIVCSTLSLRIIHFLGVAMISPWNFRSPGVIRRAKEASLESRSYYLDKNSMYREYEMKWRDRKGEGNGDEDTKVPLRFHTCSRTSSLKVDVPLLVRGNKE
jgi:hypothetical protein